MKDLKRYFPSIDESECVLPTKQHISSMNKLYSMYESGIVRDDEMWKTHLLRKNLSWSYIEKDSKAAYMVQYGSNKEFIPEVQGDEECVVMLLMNHMEKANIDKVDILSPAGDIPVTKLLKHISADIEVNNCGSLKIMDYDGLWDIIKNQSILKDKKIEGMEFRNAFIRRIFGFWHDEVELPSDLKQLADTSAINWWISTLDMV